MTGAPASLTHLLLQLLLLVSLASSSFNELQQMELFETWMLEHGKSYPSSFVREERFKLFQDNLEYINKRNSEEESYKLGLNKFADLSNSEFRAHHLGKLRIPESRRQAAGSLDVESSNYTQLPAAMDWRSIGAVTGVKDQGSCGSCWAFSAVAAIESLNFLVHGRLVSLSEQQLVDCDTAEDAGCDGGLMDDAFKYIVNNGGLDTEDDYSYSARDGSCDRAKEKIHAVSIDGFADVPANNENALLYTVARLPVSIGIEGGGRDFQFYKSGIFTGSCGTDLDHAVLAVGYGTGSSGQKYWIIKNSWGTRWGESGYMRIERTGQGSGLCGMNMMASYPIMSTRVEAPYYDDQ